MNGSESQQNETHSGTHHRAATSAEGLRTILEFTIAHRDLFKTWMNEQLAERGSNLVLDDEDITEALEQLDDILHIAMSRRQSVHVQPEVLKMVMERLSTLTDEEISGVDTDGINVIREDPDKNTGMYL